jgi:hypothetical protein
MSDALGIPIDRRTLKSAKAATKRLVDYGFKPARSRRLPKPFDRLGPRANLSELINLGSDFRAVFIWRDGETLSRTAFYGHLLRETERGLLPLAILHYHPSHKGIHGLFNCEVERDYVGRHLPGGREFELKGIVGLDPRIEGDRHRLIGIFCERFGVTLGPDGDLFHET